MAAGQLLAEEFHIPSKALDQIDALTEEKAARTPIQRKIHSNLLAQRRMARREPVARGIRTLQTGIDVSPDGMVLVDIKAPVTEEVLLQIGALGGTVINTVSEYQAIRASLPLDQVETLAALPEIISIRPAAPHLTRKVNTSEGDTAHRANTARSTFAVDGTGKKVCVLSDGVDSVAARQGTGDLPGTVTILSGQAGSGDEGTAMLEIVYDLAPGAQLFFATAAGGEAIMATNIQSLRTTFGCDVLADDVGYVGESLFQPGIIAQAINTVTAAGAMHFSAAGNNGNKNKGTSGTWEGDFADSGTTLLVNGTPSGTLHSFDGSPTGYGNLITADPTFIVLQWADALDGSANDYDLYLLNNAGTGIIAASNDTQNGTQDPLEIISSQVFNDVNNRVAIVKFSGQDRFLHLGLLQGGRLQVSTEGAIGDHQNTASTISVAAVNANCAGAGGQPFNAACSVESFSSDGVRRIFFDASGTPITPGNFSSTGGQVLQKPDMTAADGVMTSTPGFSPFFGTSAAAPHAAAIAALVLQGNSTLTPSEVRNFMSSTSSDIEAAGIDRDSGAGIVDAFAAVQAAGFTLTVSKTGSGSGTVTSNPGGINCGSTCAASFTAGTSVTLTATASAGSTFTGWSGGGCSGTATCTVTLNANTTVTATFALLFTLTVTKSGTGSGTITSSPAGIDCGTTCTSQSASFADGTSVTLTATAGTSASFGGWSGACTGMGPCTVTMTADVSVTGTFTATGSSVLLTASKAGGGTGTVTSIPAGINCGSTCSASFNAGTLMTLSANASSGSSFSGWSGGTCSGTGDCVFVLTAATTVTATFDMVATSGDGGGGGCFIATAAFGSPLAAEVEVLRQFRDQRLLGHTAGQLVVGLYYQLSPPLAAVIATHGGLRAATRTALRPIIWWANVTLRAPYLAWIILAGSGFVVMLIPISLWKRLRRKRA
jgi:hypothetical protein